MIYILKELLLLVIQKILDKNQPDNRYSIKFFTKSYLMSSLIMSCSLYDSYIKEQNKNRKDNIEKK